jgi:hypothetical protein
MDIALEFNELTSMELVTIDGGCKLCTIGSVIGGAGTGAGTVLVLASNPAGWLIGAGALVGAGLGYLATR